MFDCEKAVARCITKYNLDKEEAIRIIKTPNSELPIEDLRYKYDNMCLGKSYPDWITPENLINMCYNVVKIHNYNDYYWYYTSDELAQDLFIWATIRLNKWDNHRVLKKALCDQCKTIMRDIVRRDAPNLYSVSIYENQNNNCKSDSYTTYSNSIICEAENHEVNSDLQNIELVMSIDSIQDRSVRGILILGGYFIAGISELFDLVVKLYNESTEGNKLKIYEMCKDDEHLCNVLNLQYDREANCKVAIGKIIKLFGKRSKSCLQSWLLPYLKDVGFLEV